MVSEQKSKVKFLHLWLCLFFGGIIGIMRMNKTINNYYFVGFFDFFFFFPVAHQWCYSKLLRNEKAIKVTPITAPTSIMVFDQVDELLVTD